MQHLDHIALVFARESCNLVLEDEKAPMPATSLVLLLATTLLHMWKRLLSCFAECWYVHGGGRSVEPFTNLSRSMGPTMSQASATIESTMIMDIVQMLLLTVSNSSTKPKVTPQKTAYNLPRMIFVDERTKPRIPILTETSTLR